MKILGYGHYLPEQVVSNHDLSKLVDTSDEWIRQRTGIQERRIANENTSQLALKAAQQALKQANLEANSIDAIICATMTPDNFTPTVASMVQQALGSEATKLAFDINAACTGFIYALQVASALLGPQFQRILVIGCETMSKLIDFSDRNTCVLFGDGAGAIVLTAGQKRSYFYSGSQGNEKLLYATGPKLNSDLQATKIEGGFLQMNGKEVFKFAVKVIETSILEVLKQAEMTLADIDLIICHQANQRIISYVAKKMNIKQEQLFINLEKYGNTSAASIPLALSEAYQQKRILPNQKIILVGFGAGLTWGSVLLEVEE